ncbi:MAG: hypothetical protein GF330_11585 [Candidatus Eisenbacteria bacterium]|nr:hypothetical protein [Candidatus Eisenbacteria bacterium]
MHATVASHHGRPRWLWWLVFTGSPVALLLGAWGFRLYELQHLHGEEQAAPLVPGVLNALYHSLQMFILHTPHLEPPINLPLQLGRWLAAACFGLAALLALYRVLRTELQRVRLLRRKDHIVICGLGEVGYRLALKYRREGEKIVAIESDPDLPTVESIRNLGGTVLIGDARDAGLLRCARVQRAKQLIAVCSDDETNVGIASVAGDCFDDRAQRTEPLECWLLIGDGRLRESLKTCNVFPNTGAHYRVNVRGLDLPDLHARLLFERHPLDHAPIPEDSARRVHLVIIGFGQMGHSVLMQAVKIGHFANGKALRVTILDPHAPDHLRALNERDRHLPDICGVEAVEASADEDVLVRQASHLETSPNELLTYVACHEADRGDFQADDALNLAVALRLAKAAVQQSAQVLVFLSEQQGSALLLPRDDRRHADCANLHPFGMLDDICNESILLREEQDRLARALHAIYYEGERGAAKRENRPFPSKPAHRPWEELSEAFRDSNRQAADHMPVKLRALGLHIGPAQEEKRPVTNFTRPQREILAKMEHARWCAERWLDGWEYADARDDEQKLHPDLVPWDRLSSHEQRIDMGLVGGIPKALEMAGKAIYR